MSAEESPMSHKIANLIHADTGEICLPSALEFSDVPRRGDKIQFSHRKSDTSIYKVEEVTWADNGTVELSILYVGGSPLASDTVNRP
jgi:hypothetical protein